MNEHGFKLCIRYYLVIVEIPFRSIPHRSMVRHHQFFVVPRVELWSPHYPNLCCEELCNLMFCDSNKFLDLIVQINVVEKIESLEQWAASADEEPTNELWI